MEERRRFPRLDAGLGVKWHKAAAADKEPAREDVSKNISSLGLCLIAYEKLAIGDRLVLEIELPDKKTIPATGRVAWVRAFEVPGQDVEANYDVGIEFLEIKTEDRRLLKQFVLFADRADEPEEKT